MTVRVQLSGILLKRPFGHQSNKWSRRYFIVKDGFLLYYQDNEKRELEKRQSFNIHPKGIVPLGGCEVESGSEPGHPYVIYIKNQEIINDVAIAVETEFDHERWLELLRKSTRITWDNAILGDSMIKQLEAQGLQMAKEKQTYFDQLQSEAQALHDEQQKTEELEEIRKELEKEKQKMESLTQELREQYSNVKLELEEAVLGVKAIEDDRQYLQEAKFALQQNLEDLAKEKEKTLEDLSLRQNEAMKLTKEKENLSEVTESLRKNLKSIEDQTKRITEEQSSTEDRLRDNLEKSEQMEQEKMMIDDHVQHLEASLKDLTAQKAITEAELKEEVLARMEAERRLKEAEKSLGRLEKAVHSHTEGDDGRDQEMVQEEMKSDVKTLKKFFENLAFEAKLDSDKPVMIKNSIHARKTMVRRAMTMRYQASKRSRTKGRASPSRKTNSMCLTLPHSEIDTLTNNCDVANSTSNTGVISYRHSSIDISDDVF